MEGKVLVVDRDQNLIEILDNSLRKQSPAFGVISASDGKTALNHVKHEPVALILCNLKVPRSSYINLLRHVFEFYPDIEVIAITGFRPDEVKRLLDTNGRLQCIEHPSTVEDIVAPVTGAIKKQAEGGVLYHVTTGMFLQLIEMEQRSCTIRLIDQKTKKRGVLFLGKES